jgi:hypothetical protein
VPGQSGDLKDLFGLAAMTANAPSVNIGALASPTRGERNE